MAIQFACSCGESLCFAYDQSGIQAVCPRCGLALTVPRLGLFVAAGDKLPPPAAAKRPAVDRPIPVAAPYSPPPTPRRRHLSWLVAAALLLLVAGSLPFLFPPKGQPPEELTEEMLPPPEEIPPPLIAQVGPGGEGQPSVTPEGVSPITPPLRPATEGDDPPAVEPAPDPLQLQRLRAEKEVTGPLARDLRNELRLLRAEQAERRAEAQEVRRQLERLRAETSADTVRSVEEALAGGPGEVPFDKLAARGRAALAERDYEIAVRELTRAAALEPTDRNLQALLEAAHEGLDKVNKEVPEALEKAKDALFVGDVEAAKNIYAVLLLVAPKDKRVRDAVGRLQARIAKGEVFTVEPRWQTAEEVAALNDRPPRPPSYDWHLGGVNPEITARAIAYGQVYRMSAEQQTARGWAAGRERDVALQGESERAGRAGREHDAGIDEEGRRNRSAWSSELEALAVETARSGRAGKEARSAWDAQDARLALIGRELDGVWRQQDERAHKGAAGQMLGLLDQNGRIAQAVREHELLAREQGARMVAGGVGRGEWVEQGERAARAGRDLDAGLRVLIGRAEEAGRRLDAGLRAQDERGIAARREAGGAEIDDRIRAGGRAGRENLVGQGQRFEGGRRDPEADERARDAARRQMAQELEDRILWAARDQRMVLGTRHNAEMPAPREPEASPPPRVEDPAEKEKERDDAERALEERNRKAREAAELKRLLAERDQRQRDLDELKKLVAEKEAQEREADELKLLRAEKERLQRLRDDFKGVVQEPKKE